MQASESGKTNRGRTAVLLLLFLAALAASNALLTLLLEPALGSSHEMWQKFAGQERMDIAVAGTSQALNGIDAGELTEALGVPAFNMATNMQSFKSSREAIRAASERFGISRAVLVIDHELLYTDPAGNWKAEAAFARGRVLSGESGAIKTGLAFVLRPDHLVNASSLLFPFPWTYSRSAHIRENLSGKLTQDLPAPTRDEFGFEPSDEVVPSDVYFVPYGEAERWDEEQADAVQDLVLTKEARGELEDICALCRERGIRLTAVVVPYPNAFNIYTLRSYEQVSGELSALFGEYGFSFYDENLPREDGTFFVPDLQGYRDVGHMNSAGAEAYTRHLALRLGGEADPR